jgi:putative transposase
MGRSRYVITEPDQPHFLTCTVMEWLPLFTRPALVDILLDCWRYQRANQGLRLYGYVVLENHLHFVAQAPELNKRLSAFKSYTARRIIDHLERNGAERVLQRLRFAKRAHKVDRVYQLWQEGSHAELVCSEAVMREKLDYIHLNPVKRGYVDRAEHWSYSSARNYAGVEGLIEVDRWDT